MGAAAELHRNAWHIHHPHHLGVLLAKHGHGTSSLGLIDRHLLHLQGMGIADPAIDQGFDLADLGRRHRPGAVEIEAQTIKIHQRTGLANPGIHHLLEGRLEQVGCGVVRLGPAPASPIHLGLEHIPHRQAAALHPAVVHEHTAVADHRGNLHKQPVGLRARASPRERAPIAHLAAAFPIKRRGIQNQLHQITSLRPLGGLPIHHQGQHAAGVLKRLIALKGRGPKLRGHLLNRPLQGEIDAHGRRLGPLALGLHRRRKASQVHSQAMLLGDLLGELQGEAVGVVKLEGLFAGNLLGPRGQHIGQQLFTPLQGFQEARFLALQLGQDHVPALQQLGIGLGHQGDRSLTHGGQKRLVDAQEPAMAHHPPQQPPKDVTAAQVAGGHTIANQLGDGPAVVADHLQGCLALVVEGPVVDPRQGPRRFNQRVDQIGLVVVRHGLEDLGHPLQAHAGIDVAVRQRREVALGVAVVLHEHEVVELDKTAVVLQINAVSAQFGLEVVIDLRTGTTGARGPRSPEVVGLIHANDPLGVHPHAVAPNQGGLVVVAEDTHHQVLGAQAKDTGTELPGPLDGLLLEIIAKGKVAEHLKERVMARRAAHVLDVVGADALLGAGGPGSGPFHLPQEHRLEGQHAGNGEQHRGVVRHQGSAGHGLVAPILVEAQEGGSDLGTTAGPSCGARGRLVCRRKVSSHGPMQQNNPGKGMIAQHRPRWPLPAPRCGCNRSAGPSPLASRP